MLSPLSLQKAPWAGVLAPQHVIFSCLFRKYQLQKFVCVCVWLYFRLGPKNVLINIKHNANSLITPENTRQGYSLENNRQMILWTRQHRGQLKGNSRNECFLGQAQIWTGYKRHSPVAHHAILITHTLQGRGSKDRGCSGSSPKSPFLLPPGTPLAPLFNSGHS